MNKIFLYCIVILQCSMKWKVRALRYNGTARVYVVTPSPKPLQIDEGRSAPFYYHNWMRRADIPMNTTTSFKTTEKTKTPDLIFAEFESDSMRNIRKLLEKERADVKTTTTTTTTTMKPILVPAEEESKKVKYKVPPDSAQDEKKDMTDYFALYNNMYHSPDYFPGPIYLPSTLTPSTKTTTPASTTTTEKPVNNVEDVWHIIDSQKHDQWIDILPENDSNGQEDNIHDMPVEEDINIDENFALPGFVRNPSNGGENESRAIRTEPSMRFPYINLKPFKMKNVIQPQVSNVINNKKGNDMFTNLNNFYELKNPVRGESQDVIAPTMHQEIDRYNPAQPYLPKDYASNSKQSSPPSTPMKAVASLVPPPPPPPPQITDDDFPAPITYDSFPPYAPTDSDAGPSVPPFQQPPLFKQEDLIYSPPDDSDSLSYNNAPPMDVGYKYRLPSPPVHPFVPTLPTLKQPFAEYSKDKPIMTFNPPMEDKPESSGYHYNKPVPSDSYFNGYNNDKPISASSDGYNYNKPTSASPEFGGYHYNKPEPPSKPMDLPPAYHSYDHHESPHYGHDLDLPETVYEKPHGGHGSYHGGSIKDDDDDMGMEPPRIEAPDTKHTYDSSPVDDSGFPHDFPADLDFHQFHDDHDHDVYHYHHPTTTTSTTEMPRVNRFSYYYLGKKLYYLPLYFSVYFIVYVGALIIKAVLRHKIVYPNSWRPNDQTATFFTKRSVDSLDWSKEKLHEITRKVTKYIATAAEKYMEKNE